MSGYGGEWIREAEGNTTVVFVHGVLSSGETCWRNENGSYWPDLLKNEPELKSIGVYVFTYETGIFSGSYRLGDIVDALKECMKLDKVDESERLIFVCHSMGGIVVRKFLVERAIELIQGQREIGLFLVASPSLGSSYADWLSPLAQLFGHSQADVLRFVRNNEWLQDLDKEFLNLKEAGRLKIKGKELVEDKFISLKKVLRRQIVEPFSGARYFGEPFKVPASDHFSIAKPKDKDAIQHRELCQFIKDTSEVPAEKAGRMRKLLPGYSTHEVADQLAESIAAGERLLNSESPTAPAYEGWRTEVESYLDTVFVMKEGKVSTDEAFRFSMASWRGPEEAMGDLKQHLAAALGVLRASILSLKSDLRRDKDSS